MTNDADREIVGRHFEVLKETKAFSRDFMVVGASQYCYQIENAMESYPIAKVALQSHLLCGHIRVIEMEIPPLSADEARISDDDIPF